MSTITGIVDEEEEARWHTLARRLCTAMDADDDEGLFEELSVEADRLLDTSWWPQELEAVREGPRASLRVWTDTVAAFAKPVLAVKGLFQAVQARLPDDASRIVSLHRAEPGCYEASLAYLESGSMARRVGRERIQQVAQPTLIVWGTEDDILPLSDAYAFERDLQHCVGVREVPGSGHSPHLDQPEAVLAHLRPFVAQR